MLFHSSRVFEEVSYFIKCISIHTHYILNSRFIEIEEIHDPQLILVVGCVGLFVNLIGLLLFHGIKLLNHYDIIFN